MGDVAQLSAYLEDKVVKIKSKVFELAEKYPPLMKVYKNLSRTQANARKEMSDEEYLKLRYRQAFGYELNLENPQTFNEKIQWLKLHDRKPIYTTMVDKYLAKQYIADRVGSEYVIPTLGRWDEFEDIDFDQLPERFVLKCNHDSGSVFICKDKKTFDYVGVGGKMNAALQQNYYWMTREWPYKDVKPCIIAEPYMEDSTTHELRDYKFLCFDGVPKLLYVASDRQVDKEQTKFDFYDMDFHHLAVKNGHPNSSQIIVKPTSFNKMVELAAFLSKGFPLLRIDFYEVDGKPYIGELTFSHMNGMTPFDPEEWDYKFGEWISLPKTSNYRRMIR